MSNATTIEWTDRTANPVRFKAPDGKRAWHCEKVSQGCANCYAEHLEVKRYGSGRPFTPAGGKDLTPYLDEAVLQEIIRRKAPTKFFLGDMTDLFGHWVKDEWLDAIFATAALCPQHTFQILTKRPERMREYLTEPARLSRIYSSWYRTHDDDVEMLPDFQLPLPNVWLGTSIEDQATADVRVPELLKTPATVRFLSYEPALGPVDLRRVGKTLRGDDYDALAGWRTSYQYKRRDESECSIGVHAENGHPHIHWVICGGESGPNARPMHPDWARSVRDQCQAAGVAFFFKQWGAFGIYHEVGYPKSIRRDMYWVNPIDGRYSNEMRLPADFDQEQRGLMTRVGKKRAGRQLDGREWNEFPKAVMA